MPLQIAEQDRFVTACNSIEKSPFASAQNISIRIRMSFFFNGFARGAPTGAIGDFAKHVTKTLVWST